MNKKVLAIFLFAMLVSLLLMGFGAAVTLAQSPTPLPSATQTPLPPSLQMLGMFRFKVEDVTKFQVSGSGRTVAFTRQPDGWRADSKENTPYEKIVATTLDHLIRLEGGIITSNPPDMATYGLHAPTITVAMFVSGTGEVPLSIGKPDPVRPSNYYANNFPHTAPIYSISGTIVEELQGYLKPVPSPTPTKPTPSPSPSATATATTVPTRTPTLTPSPVPPVQVAAVTPPSTPPSPTPLPIPKPTATPPPNVVQMLIQFVVDNSMLAAIGSGVCLVVLFAFAALAVWFLRRQKPEPPDQVPSPPSPFLEGITIPGLDLHLTRENMTLGRAPDCALSIPEDAPGADTLSRYHARFEKRGSRWAVIDGGEEGKLSTNGVYVNDKRTLECYLTDNDEIRFGDVKFRFHAQPVNANPVTGGQP